MINNSANSSIKELNPVIVSASRATDIPAFYSDWFVNRIKEGYLIKFNPYNNRPYKINFCDTKFIVFWTKNPKPIIKHLPFFDSLGIRYYFQYTLNDYSREGYEKNVLPLKDRIETFKNLSDIIGKEKVVWRFDPLILSDKIALKDLLLRIENTGDEISDYTKRLVISFFDNYKSVEKNLKKFGFSGIREFEKSEITEFATGLSSLNKKWNLGLSACSEDISLLKYKISKGRCIDSNLIREICSDDSFMLKYLEENSGKDKGQRPLCGCIPSTDTGQYNTCIHGCAYCYATRNPVLAINNYRLLLKNPKSESMYLKGI